VAGDQHLDEGWSANVQTLIALSLLLIVIVGIGLAASYATPIADRFVDESTPQTSFSFAYDDQASTLTVEHSGGSSIPGHQLLVQSGNRTVADFSAYERVESGDVITVRDVDRDDSIRVVWRRQGHTLVLAQWPR